MEINGTGTVISIENNLSINITCLLFTVQSVHDDDDDDDVGGDDDDDDDAFIDWTALMSEADRSLWTEMLTLPLGLIVMLLVVLLSLLMLLIVCFFLGLPGLLFCCCTSLIRFFASRSIRAAVAASELCLCSALMSCTCAW